MKHFRWFAVALFLTFAISSAFAAPEKVSYKSGDETVQGLLYQPTTEGKHPALVVVPEWWGVTPWIQQQAQDFADHGYSALVVDLYRGKSTDNPEIAHELMRGLPEDRAMRDLNAAVDYLRTRPEVEIAVNEARSAPGTFLINFLLEKEESVYPMIPAGSALHEMIRRPGKDPLLETPDDK